jgi:Fe(3+) dicitrate transport protein
MGLNILAALMKPSSLISFKFCPRPLLGLSLLAAPALSFAQEVADTTNLAPITVVGSAEEIKNTAGAAAFVSQSEIRTQTYSNPNRVLTRVPGVYVREEDGFGNFANISLRGVDPGRSAKVTIMEDGIMMAPAPYSDPAAYYSPRIGRMSGVEILKGSSQVRYGPHNTGGVVNYLSTPFAELVTSGAEAPAGGKTPVSGKGVVSGKSSKGPAPVAVSADGMAETFYLKSTYGTDNAWFNHGYWARTQETSAGTVGWVVEMHHAQNDGFRTIDKVGGDTGYRTLDPNFKLFWEPNSPLKQRFELRLGYTDFEADETYVGLTERDFRNDPYRRYASTQFDNMDYHQYRAVLSHVMEPTANLRIETNAYYTSFDRSWYKLDSVQSQDGSTSFNVANVLVAGGEGLNILKGNAAGIWKVRDNNRDYYTSGVQQRLDYGFDTGSVEHDLTVGWRVHYDEVRRLQRDDKVFTTSNGSVDRIARGFSGSGGNRLEETLAFSAYIEDAIKIGALTIKPGVRFEHLEQEFTDFSTTDTSGRTIDSASGSTDIVAPGLGLNYEINDKVSAFASYYRGFSTPGPRESLHSGLEEELSNGYELGLRHYGDSVQAELVGFYTDFQDLIVQDKIGSSGATESTNGGDIEVYGVEAALRWDPMTGTGSAWSLPTRLSATYTHGELKSEANSANAETIFSGGRIGNEVPYIPEFTLSAGIGIVYGDFGLFLDASYTPETFGTASNTTSLRTPEGKPDARFGKTDDALILDLSARWQASENITLLAGISNLLGEEYLSSRIPLGPRAGEPRAFYGGVEIKF